MSAKALGQYAPFVSTGKPAASDRVHLRERRRRVRTKVHWPVVFRHEAGEAGEAVESVTEDLSSHGFYCLSRVPFAFGELLLCWLTVPVHDPSKTKCTALMECNVRVVRCASASEEGLYGVACRIEDYHFVGSEWAWPSDGLGKREGKRHS